MKGTVRRYRLQYDSDRFGKEKTIEFDAINPAGALLLAKREAEGRWARLYEGERLLCRLERLTPDSDDLWAVAGVAGEIGPSKQ